MQPSPMAPSQVCYRVLMDQCMEHGRPALAVRVYSDMRNAGIQPSAVTYAFYNKAMMESNWPSTKRRWKILKIVIFACLHLCWLQQEHYQKEGGMRSRKVPDLSSRTRQTSSDSSDLSALDVEGEEVDCVPSLLQRRLSSGRLRRSCVYRLSKQQSGGDYAVKEGAFYMADKLPLWGRIVEEEGENRLSIRWWLGGRSRYSLRQMTSSDPLWGSHEKRRGVKSGVNVEMSSCSQCAHCCRLLYDEELMVCWSEDAGDYSITCPYCQGSLVPSLSIRMRKVCLLVRSQAMCRLSLSYCSGCQKTSISLLRVRCVHQALSLFVFLSRKACNLTSREISFPGLILSIGNHQTRQRQKGGIAR